MLERLFPCYCFEEAGCLSAKGTAGGRYQYPGNGKHVFPNEALKNGRMLRVNRNEFDAMLPREIHDEITRNNECLLVGESDILARFDSLYRRAKSREPNERSQHHVNIIARNDFLEGILSGQNFDVCATKSIVNLSVVVLITDDDRSWLCPEGLLDEQLGIVVCC